jgi:hypothetical protein
MELIITFEFGEDVRSKRTYERFFQIDVSKNSVGLKRIYHLQPDELNIDDEKEISIQPVMEREFDLISFLRNYALIPSISFWKLHFELHECRNKRSLQDNIAFFISALFIKDVMRAKSILKEMQHQRIPLQTMRVFNQAIQELTC